MAVIVLKVRLAVKLLLLKNVRGCREAGTKLRFLMVINILNGRSVEQTAAPFSAHRERV